MPTQKKAKKDNTMEQIANDLNQSSIGGISFNPSVMNPKIREELGRVVGLTASTFRATTQAYQAKHAGEFPINYDRLGYLDQGAPDLSYLGIGLSGNSTIRDVEGKLALSFGREIVNIAKRSVEHGGRFEYQDVSQTLTTRILESLRGTGIPEHNENGYDPALAGKGGVSKYINNIIFNTTGSLQRDNVENSRNTGLQTGPNSPWQLTTEVDGKIWNDAANEIATEDIGTRYKKQFFEHAYEQGYTDPQAESLFGGLNPAEFENSTIEEIRSTLEKRGIPTSENFVYQPKPQDLRKSTQTIGAYSKVVQRPRFSPLGEIIVPATYEQVSAQEKQLNRSVFAVENSIFNPVKINPEDPRFYKDFAKRIAAINDTFILRDANGNESAYAPGPVSIPPELGDARKWVSENNSGMLTQYPAGPISGPITPGIAQEWMAALDLAGGYFDGKYHKDSKDFSLFEGDTPAAQEQSFRAVKKQVKAILGQLNTGTGGLGAARLGDNSEYDNVDLDIVSAGSYLIPSIEKENERGKERGHIVGPDGYPYEENGHVGLYSASQITSKFAEKVRSGEMTVREARAAREEYMATQGLREGRGFIGATADKDTVSDFNYGTEMFDDLNLIPTGGNFLDKSNSVDRMVYALEKATNEGTGVVHFPGLKAPERIHRMPGNVISQASRNSKLSLALSELEKDSIDEVPGVKSAEGFDISRKLELEDEEDDWLVPDLTVDEIYANLSLSDFRAMKHKRKRTNEDNLPVIDAKGNPIDYRKPGNRRTMREAKDKDWKNAVGDSMERARRAARPIEELDGTSLQSKIDYALKRVDYRAVKDDEAIARINSFRQENPLFRISDGRKVFDRSVSDEELETMSPYNQGSARNYTAPERLGWNFEIPEGGHVVEENRSMVKDGNLVHAWVQDKTVHWNRKGLAAQYDTYRQTKIKLGETPVTPEVWATAAAAHEHTHLTEILSGRDMRDRKSAEQRAQEVSRQRRNEEIDPELREQLIREGKLEIVPDKSTSILSGGKFDPATMLSLDPDAEDYDNLLDSLHRAKEELDKAKSAYRDDPSLESSSKYIRAGYLVQRIRDDLTAHPLYDAGTSASNSGVGNNSGATRAFPTKDAINQLLQLGYSKLEIDKLPLANWDTLIAEGKMNPAKAATNSSAKNPTGNFSDTDREGYADILTGITNVKKELDEAESAYSQDGSPKNERKIENAKNRLRKYAADKLAHPMNGFGEADNTTKSPTSNSGVGNPPASSNAPTKKAALENAPQETDWEAGVEDPFEEGRPNTGEKYVSPYTSAPHDPAARHAFFMDKAKLTEEPTLEDAKKAMLHLKNNNPGYEEHFAGNYNAAWKQFDAYFAQISPESQKAWYTVQAYHHPAKGKRGSTDPLNVLYKEGDDPVKRRLELSRNKATEEDFDKNAGGTTMATEMAIRMDAAPKTKAAANGWEELKASSAGSVQDDKDKEFDMEEILNNPGAVPVRAGVPGLDPTRDTDPRRLLTNAEKVLEGFQNDLVNYQKTGEGDPVSIQAAIDTAQHERDIYFDRFNRPNAAQPVRTAGDAPDEGLNNPALPMNRLGRAGEAAARGMPFNYTFTLNNPQDKQLISNIANDAVNYQNRPYSEVLGQPVETRRVINGHPTSEVSALRYEKDGKITVDEKTNATATELGKAAVISSASGDYGGLDPKEQQATLNSRINKYINDYVNKNYQATSNDPAALAEASALRKQIIEVARTAVKPALERIGGAIGVEDKGWMGLASNAQRINKKADLQSHMDNNPELARKINEEMGGIDNAWAGEMKIVNSGGEAIQFGNGSGKSGGGGDGDLMQSIYRTPLGRLQMAMFMGKMVWQESGGAVMDSAQQYRNTASAFAASDVFGGGAVSQAAAGNSIIDQAQRASEKTAYNQFGGVAEAIAKARLSPAGEIGNRLWNDTLWTAGTMGVATVAATVASAGIPGLLSAGALASGAAVAAPVGMVVGTGLLLNEAIQYANPYIEDAQTKSGVTPYWQAGDHGIASKVRGFSPTMAGPSATIRGPHFVTEDNFGGNSSIVGGPFGGDPFNSPGISYSQVSRPANASETLNNVAFDNAFSKQPLGNITETKAVRPSGLQVFDVNAIGLKEYRAPETISAEALAEKIVAENKGIQFKDLPKDIAFVQSKIGGIKGDGQVIQDIIESGVRKGKSPEQMFEQGAGYATSQGLTIGTPEYGTSISDTGKLGPKELATRSGKASIQNQIGSQFLMQFGGVMEDASPAMAALGINTQGQAGSAMSIFASAERTGMKFDTNTSNAYMSQFSKYSPLQQQSIATGMGTFTNAGFDAGSSAGMMTGLINAGISAPAATELTQMNKYTWSQTARSLGLTADLRGMEMVDTVGTASGTRSGGAVADYMMKAAGIPFMSWPRSSPSQQQTQNAQRQDFLVGKGVSEGFASSFLQGGFDQVQREQQDKMYGYQQQSFGLQARGIEARAAMNTASWAIDDRQIALQQGSENASLAFSKTQMVTRNQFSIENENAQRTSSLLNRSYSNENMAFGRQTDLMQRDNTRAGWQYQAQTSELSYGWSMEDLDENIRRSSGRERSLLIRQKDRATTSRNLELGETDRQHGAQETLWKREDERYKKQEEYVKASQKLEDEAFKRGQTQRETLFKMDMDDLNRRMAETKEGQKLQIESQTLQRKFQTDELQRSKEALSIQIAQAASQFQYNKDIELAQKGQRDMEASFAAIAGNAKNIKEMADSLIAISKIRFELVPTPVGGWAFSATTIPRGTEARSPRPRP